MNIIKFSEIMELTTMDTIRSLGIPILIATLGFTLSGYLARKNNNIDYIIIGVIAFIVGICIEVVSLTHPNGHTGKYRYVATLDKSYSAVELFENYTNISYDAENNLFYFSDK